MHKYTIAILLFCFMTNGNSQSLDTAKIYATQFRNVIYLDNQHDVSLHKFGEVTIHILESNENDQVTRELNRLSDSTFLYTEYLAMDYEAYVKDKYRRITKQGIIEFSHETIIDSSVIWNPDTYETYPSPRKRNIFKQTGEWYEIYKHFDKNYKIKGSYNHSGKHGNWYYYTNRKEVDKIMTYENGILIGEEFINILNYKSVEKTREIIQRNWTLYDTNNSPYLTTSRAKKKSSSYKFNPDGTFRNSTKRKGTWSLIDYKTIEIKAGSRTRTLTLEHVTEDLVRYTRNY